MINLSGEDIVLLSTYAACAISAKLSAEESDLIGNIFMLVGQALIVAASKKDAGNAEKNTKVKEIIHEKN